jgi:hypothetical protein
MVLLNHTSGEVAGWRLCGRSVKPKPPPDTRCQAGPQAPHIDNETGSDHQRKRRSRSALRLWDLRLARRETVCSRAAVEGMCGRKRLKATSALHVCISAHNACQQEVAKKRESGYKLGLAASVDESAPLCIWGHWSKRHFQRAYMWRRILQRCASTRVPALDDFLVPGLVLISISNHRVDLVTTGNSCPIYKCAGRKRFNAASASVRSSTQCSSCMIQTDPPSRSLRPGLTRQQHMTIIIDIVA